MRVIKDNSIKEKEIVCFYCGSEIAYTKEDMQVNYWIGRVTSKYYFIVCPICGHTITVEEWYK